MPQFNFATYPSQIFWFIICFTVLYLFMARVFLPRIKNIIAQRKSIIDNDLSSAASLESDILEAQKKSDELKASATLKYKTTLENSLKNANLKREKMLEEFKNNAEKMVESTHKKIAQTVENSKAQNTAAVKKIADLTSSKIFKN